MNYDVVIVGGGIIGTLTARELMKYKLSVCLVERCDDVAAGGATKANSAIVHGGFDPEIGTLKAKLNVKGTEMMPALAAELGVPYVNNGSLVLAFDSEQLEVVNELFHRGYRNGVKGLAVLNKNQVLEMEPNVSDSVVGALYCPSSGIVSPYQLAIAAMGNAMDNGAVLKTGFEVKKIEKAGDVFALSSDTETVYGKYVVNCAGVYADKVAAMIGDNRYTVTPKKGEYILLDKSEGGLVSHTIFQAPTAAGKGILVTPTVGKNLLLGPTSVALSDKEDTDTTAGGLEAVAKTAAKSVKNLNVRKAITSFAGLRSYIGGDFVIEPSVKDAHFINTVGIDSPGLSSSPAIVETVIEILKNQGLKAEKNENFNGKRTGYQAFAKMSVEDKNKAIAKNPKYGKIVCRCESITEGEIIDAIRRNPPATTLDGIKRRTKARMGRCQGGFCTTYITEILARELGVSEYEVTMKSQNSKLLTEVEERENN